MPNIDSHAPGTFSWIELATSDTAGAKSFYSSLFGWQVADFPMGKDEVYTMFKLDGRDAAAAYAMNAEMRANGVPPHWALYVSVVSADETAAAATAAGATVIAGPFDVYDFGRMAVIKDPQGAVFSIWQTKQHFGTGIAGVPGTLCWADLSVPDQAEGAAFYKTLFGWEALAGQDESGYQMIKAGDQFIGGILPPGAVPPGVPPHWMPYFLVADAAASVAQVAEFGGEVKMGPIEMNNVGRYAVALDPQGAAFAIFEPAQKG